MDIDELPALVAGGGHGLGEAIARRLADDGADVTVLDADGDAAAMVAGDIGGYSQHCDISNAEHAALGVSAAMARFGQAPRVVVNCVSSGISVPILGREGRTSVPQFRRALDVDVNGAYHVLSFGAQAMMDLPLLETGERGVIVLVSQSMAPGRPSSVADACCRAALAGLAQTAAEELAPHAIRVVHIACGAFQTSQVLEVSREVRDRHVAEVPFPKRLGDPAECASLVAHVIANPYLNGATLRLDGADRRT